MDLTSFRNWVKESRFHLQANGLSGVTDILRPPYMKFLHQINQLAPPGTNIYSEDWDVLIVLDACRHDYLHRIIEDYLVVKSYDTRWSVGSMTAEWMNQTFIDEFSDLINQTAYVCASPFSDSMLNAVNFEFLDEVWKYAWDDDIGTVPASVVTDRAIKVGREMSPNRLLIHYMQPHVPFVELSELTSGMSVSKGGFALGKSSGGFFEVNDLWDELKFGNVSKSDIIEGCVSNLKYVLSDVKALTENLNSTSTIITADHGNSFGEWGVYGHPMRMPLSSIRRVPWVTIETTDQGEYSPSDYIRSDETNTKIITERLEALGYR